MVSNIYTEASAAGTGGPVVLSLAGGLKIGVTLPPRNVTLAELQRLKRQFVTIHKKAITLGSTEKGRVDWDEESIGRKFAAYLEEHLKS